MHSKTNPAAQGPCLQLCIPTVPRTPTLPVVQRQARRKNHLLLFGCLVHSILPSVPKGNIPLRLPPAVRRVAPMVYYRCRRPAHTGKKCGGAKYPAPQRKCKKMAEWNKMDNAETPALSTITAWVNSPLWDDLLAYLHTRYGVLTHIEYSRCSVPGWNVKFKKAGKGLCTLYPERGRFVALVVISAREKVEMELLLPELTAYTRHLYATTKEGMGQRWLMFDVDRADILADVKRCIALRRAPNPA